MSRGILITWDILS